MNLIVAETRAIMETAIDSINNWKNSDGASIFPMSATNCWSKKENIKELKDGRFAISTVPHSILEEHQIDVGNWFEDFDVIQIDDAKDLILIREPEQI